MEKDRRATTYTVYPLVDSEAGSLTQHIAETAESVAQVTCAKTVRPLPEAKHTPAYATSQKLRTNQTSSGDLLKTRAHILSSDLQLSNLKLASRRL